MVKILVPIDSDSSSNLAASLAVHKALELQKEGLEASITFVNLYSYWDFTSHQKNSGVLSMDQAISFAEAHKVLQKISIVFTIFAAYTRKQQITNGFAKFTNVITYDNSTISTCKDFLNLIDELRIDIVIVGKTSYSAPTDPDSMVSQWWSYLINSVRKSLAQYLEDYATCEVIVIALNGETHTKPAAT